MAKMPFLFQRSGRRHLSPYHLAASVNFIPIFKKFYAFLIAVHAVAVIWSLLKQNDPESFLQASTTTTTTSPSEASLIPSNLAGDNNPDYTTSVYFVMATLSTCGFGDTVIDGPLQQVFAMILCVAAIVLNGIVIGLVVENMRQSDIYTERANKLRETLGVCQYFQIPSSLLNEILSFQNHVLEHNLGAAYNNLIRGLPQDMRSNIGLYIRVSLISHVTFFADAHQGAKVAIAQRLKPFIYLPEQYIFIAGEVGDSMYFISHGFVDVVTTDGTLVASLKTGDHVGESALLERDNLRRVSVKALTYCDLFQLSCSDFMLILVRFPKVRRRMAEEATQLFEGSGGMTSEVEIVGGTDAVSQNDRIGGGEGTTINTHEEASSPSSSSRSPSIGIKRVHSAAFQSVSSRGGSPVKKHPSSSSSAFVNHQQPQPPSPLLRVLGDTPSSTADVLPGQVVNEHRVSLTAAGLVSPFPSASSHSRRVPSSFQHQLQTANSHNPSSSHLSAFGATAPSSSDIRRVASSPNSNSDQGDNNTTPLNSNTRDSACSTPLTTTNTETGRVLSYRSSGVHPMLLSGFSLPSGGGGRNGGVDSSSSSPIPSNNSSSKLGGGNGGGNSNPQSNRALLGGGSMRSTNGTYQQTSSSNARSPSSSSAAAVPATVTSVSASLPVQEQLDYCKSLVRNMRSSLRNNNNRSGRNDSSSSPPPSPLSNNVATTPQRPQ